MTHLELSKVLVELLGGKENIISVTNCMTRLRLKIKNLDLVQVETIKSTEGVMGVVFDAGVQIIVGPGKAQKMKDIFVKELGVTELGSAGVEVEASNQDWQANKDKIKQNQKHSPIKDGLKLISNIFIPLLPAIIAAGLFNGFASLLAQLGKQGVINIASGKWFLIQTIFSLIGSGFLGYFAIFTGINAAKQFGATEALGGIIGAISIAPAIDTISKALGWFNEAERLNSVLISGKGGIIGVIFGVWILSLIEKRLRKVIPDTLDLILTPTITLLITTLLMVFALMPLAGVVSDLLMVVLDFFIQSTNPIMQVISGFVLAAMFLPMVLLGLHHGLIPIYAIQLETAGAVSLFPVLAMAGAGQVGAAIAIYVKARRVKNERLKAVITGALPAGILGVGEPLIYGVTLPLGKPFITAGIGAGFGGAFIMMMGVAATAWGPSGIVAIPLMNGLDAMLYFAIGLVVSYVAGFIITYVFVKDSEVEAV